MEQTMLSAGIDIGTSTTQLIFSRLTLCRTGGFGSIPRVEISDKKILYRMKTAETPLTEQGIDAEGVAELLRRGYKEAGFSRSDPDTGAVIITGETARKRNARQVLEAISDMAGSFVAASAGPELESILAGKGSGAEQLSRENGKITANLDVGGGTTNICLFKNGIVLGTTCLNLGGRLIRVHDGKIESISQSLMPLIRDGFQEVRIGYPADPALLTRLTDRMAELMAMSVGLLPRSDDLTPLEVCQPLRSGLVPEVITFSGGVSDCMLCENDDFAYGDIGVLLGRSLRKCSLFGQRMQRSVETGNATVIGAGNFSMEVSGSTIHVPDDCLPMKGLPVRSIRLETHEDIALIADQTLSIISQRSEYEGKPWVLYFKGLECPSFPEIEAIAENLTGALHSEVRRNCLPVFAMERDIAKALGQAILRRIGQYKKLICIDGVCCTDGDFIDIGNRLTVGASLPIIVRTLVFESGETDVCD